MQANKKPVELPAPRTSAPVEEGTAQIVLAMGGKRYEIKIKVTATELPEKPVVAGVVIEMPKATE